MAKEIEVKFKIETPCLIEKDLKKLGAKKIRQTFEKDTYYAFPSLKKTQLTIRLRKMGNKGLFTLKYPVSKEKSKRYKILNELETTVKDVVTFGVMLKKIGFKPVFLKEKFRKTYTLRHALITIDKLPHIGFYIEIEGAKNSIKEISRLLKLDQKRSEVLTYADIFERYKKAHNKPGIKFLF